MEEFEILDLEELSKEKGFNKASLYLQNKLQKGYKVSVMVKKVYHISLPPLSSKKNDFFSKSHQPIEINTQTESSQNENRERLASSTSSHSSLPKQTIPPTQNETPEQQMEEIESQSSGEQVSFYHLKDNTFEHQLKGCQQNKKIQNALLFYKDGNLKEALTRFMENYNDCMDQLKQTEEQSQIKLFVLLCIQSMCYSGQIYRALGNCIEAIKLYDKCLNQFEINDFDILGKIYMEKGLCYLQNNQLLQALDQYNRALLQYEQVNWKLDIARVLIKMSQIYAMLNNYEDAKKMCYEGLRIYQLKLGQQDPRIFETYHILGTINYFQKDYDFAIEYLNQALDGLKKIYNDKHISLVKIYNLLGVINQIQGNMNMAIELYEQIICLYGDETNIGLASVLNNLALVYLDKMKFKSARLSFDKALSILKEYFIDSHPMVKRIQKNAGLVALATLSYL